MNLNEYIEKAKKILGTATLKEDAGSEGLQYIVEYTGTFSIVGDEAIVESLPNKDGIKQCKLTFKVPKDYGFTLQYLKDLKVEVKALHLQF